MKVKKFDGKENVWVEIQYFRKEDGESVHSDLGVPESEAREILPEFFAEILKRADFSKPWTLRCNGEDE